MAYDSTCEYCKYVVAHYVNGQLTGYGYCTKHEATQLKTSDDSAKIEKTPIVFKDCSCPLGELRNP